MVRAHFRVLNNELLDKDTDVVPEQEPIIILDSKLAMCTSNNVTVTKYTRHISRIMHFLINVEGFNL